MPFRARHCLVLLFASSAIVFSSANLMDLFVGLDTNKDGVIDKEEWLSGEITLQAASLLCSSSASCGVATDGLSLVQNYVFRTKVEEPADNDTKISISPDGLKMAHEVRDLQVKDDLSHTEPSVPYENVSEVEYPMEEPLAAAFSEESTLLEKEDTQLDTTYEKVGLGLRTYGDHVVAWCLRPGAEPTTRVASRTYYARRAVIPNCPAGFASLDMVHGWVIPPGSSDRPALRLQCSYQGARQIRLSGWARGPRKLWGHFLNLPHAVRPDSNHIIGYGASGYGFNGRLTWRKPVLITTEGWVMVWPQNQDFLQSDQNIQIHVEWNLPSSCQHGCGNC